MALPLKWLAGVPEFVSVMGPVRGLAFVGYLVLAVTVVAGRDWRAREVARVVGAALLPFGTFANDRFLAREQAGEAAP